MAETYSPPEYQSVCEVYVTSIERSLAFYKSLGFDVHWTVPEIFAQISWEGCLVFLKQKDGLAVIHDGKRAERPGSGNIRLMVSDVNTKYKECKELGCTMQQDIGDRLFVLRDFIIQDPDGFGIRFGSFSEGRGRVEQKHGPGAGSNEL